MIFIFLFQLLLACSVQGDLFRAAQIDRTVALALERSMEGLPFEDQLDDFFDAYYNNETEHMTEVLDHLKDEDITNEPDAMHRAMFIHDNLIKYVPDRIKAEGYPAEVHEVTTKDGYILELHRIPHGRKSPKTYEPRQPVLLMHGFLESSNGWVVLGSENSLAYLLADEGYDVFMANARGTEPSRRHLTLKPDQKEFWQYSWHEIGVYDLPTFIDHILSETKFKKLHFFGYSQGSTAFFVMTSMLPEYNDKIILANLMAPVAALDGDNLLHNAIARFYTPLKKVFSALGIHKLTVDNQLASKIVEVACKKLLFASRFACKLLLTPLQTDHINTTSIPYIMISTPSGVSVRQGLHFLQSIRRGGFRQFDYDDRQKNWQVYGSEIPPAYNLNYVTVPVHIFHSKADNTASVRNVLRLASQLPNVKSRYLMPVNTFAHIDFTYSYLAGEVNKEIIRRIKIRN